MISKVPSVRKAGTLASALCAGLSAAIVLANCTKAEDPVSPGTTAEARPAADVLPERVLPEGRPATAAEVAQLGQAKGLPALPELPAASEPLRKAAALSVCVNDFNQSFGLGLMVDQAWSTFTSSPHYIHGCNGNNYWMYSWPVNLDHFHLAPENPNHCYGTSPKWGVKAGTSCVGQSDAKYWPRIATNMGSNTGVQFYVKSSGNVRKNFDLKAITVVGGTLELWAYRVGVGWWYWNGLTPGRWTFPLNSFNLSEVQVFHHGKNGTITYDNLEIAIIP